MNIVNGIIVNQDFVEEILKKGFEVLNEQSPYARGTTKIYSSRVSEERIIWKVYHYQDNFDNINKIGDGEYAIFPGAKPFVSLIHSDDYLQIDPSVQAFNHLAAIQYFINH